MSRIGAWRPRNAVPAVTLLAAAVAFAISWEAWLWAGPFAAGQAAASAWWYLPPALVSGGAALAVRPLRHRLRPWHVVTLSTVLYLGFLAVHQLLGGPADQDIRELYPRYGRALLDSGTLPATEYPPAAVVAFAAARALGPVDLTLPLLTLPLLALAWWRLARVGPDAPWLTAAVALLPTLVPFWEVKFDALPAALLVLGVLDASRGRWGLSGAWLGAGAAVKWYPGLALPVLLVALVRQRRWAPATRMGGGALLAVGAFTLPFATRPDGLLSPYRFHAARGITGESLPYLPLRLAGLADAPDRPWFEATVPAWAPELSLVAVTFALVAVIATAAVRPRRASVLAAAAPVVFLLGNRIFSPQFLLPLAAAWALGMALSSAGRGVEQAAFVLLVTTAATSNYAVWPTAASTWLWLQALLFAAALVVSAIAFTRPPDRDPRADPSLRQVPAPP